MYNFSWLIEPSGMQSSYRPSMWTRSCRAIYASLFVMFSHFLSLYFRWNTWKPANHSELFLTTSTLRFTPTQMKESHASVSLKVLISKSWLNEQDHALSKCMTDMHDSVSSAHFLPNLATSQLSTTIQYVTHTCAETHEANQTLSF